MGQKPGFKETLRRLAMIDEGFVEDQAGFGLGLTGTPALDPKTAALLQIAASVAIGSPAVCPQWCAGRALAGGASEDEIVDVLLAIAGGRLVYTDLGWTLTSGPARQPRPTESLGRGLA